METTKLKLIETETFSCGVIALHYETKLMNNDSWVNNFKVDRQQPWTDKRVSC